VGGGPRAVGDVRASGVAQTRGMMGAQGRNGDGRSSEPRCLESCMCYWKGRIGFTCDVWVAVMGLVLGCLCWMRVDVDRFENCEQGLQRAYSTCSVRDVLYPLS